jgi:rubrerythrin
MSRLIADLQDEYDSIAKYQYQMIRVTNPLIKAKLKSLLEIERRHVELLERLLGMHMEVHVDTEKPLHQEGKGLHELLAQDYEDERQAYLRYRRQSLETEDGELRQILEHMAEEELDHMEMLKEMYRTLP